MVPVRRALVLALKGKAEVVHENGQVFHSETLEIRAPSVVRLNYFMKVPFRARASLSRRAVFVRDEFECQYCGAKAENVDHIVPRSRGGTHTWDNVVAACRPCNMRKEDHLLHETSLILRRTPQAPRERLWILVATGSVRKDWEPYIKLSA